MSKISCSMQKVQGKQRRVPLSDLGYGFILLCTVSLNTQNRLEVKQTRCDRLLTGQLWRPTALSSPSRELILTQLKRRDESHSVLHTDESHYPAQRLWLLPLFKMHSDVFFKLHIKLWSHLKLVLHSPLSPLDADPPLKEPLAAMLRSLEWNKITSGCRCLQQSWTSASSLCLFELWTSA